MTTGKKRLKRTKQNLYKETTNPYIKEGDYLKADTVGKVLVVAIILFVISPIATVLAVNHSIESQISGLKDSINGLSNNQAFSESIDKVSDSVYMIINLKFWHYCNMRSI